MSNQLNGTFKMAKGASVKGKQGKLVHVPVNVKSKVNRGTDASRIARYTKRGFDWNKWSLPIVAKLPCGTQYLLDGDHRRHMYVQFHPEQETMPAWEIGITSEEEFHNLFVEINSTHRKNVNGDEAFVHLVLAAEPKSLELKRQLVHCGVSVNGSPEPSGVVGAPGSRHVKINSFKRALKLSDENAVKKAVVIIDNAWDPVRYPEWSDKVQGELLQGFAVLYRHYANLSNGSPIQADFE